MNILLLGQFKGRPRSISLGRFSVVSSIILACFFLVAGGGFYAGYFIGLTDTPVEPQPVVAPDVAAADEIYAEIAHGEAKVGELRDWAKAELESVGSRLGEMQARMVRIDAVGERLVRLAKLDEGEFDFNAMPPIGGVSDEVQEKGLSSDGLTASLESLMGQLENRERQLNVLEGLLLENELAVEMSPSGRPVTKGWISSRFGKRRDPVSGKKSFHRGLDFAGKRGADVQAIAAGVITFSGRKTNYGNIVVIDHGNGYVTRYAHNQKNLVKAGDVVKRGHIIAKLGSTGRSTGPHVHLEVLKDGRYINPLKLVRNTN